MERNWLIRTTQNQILGPVAKTKLLEFIQKGALGMMDEVASGNGYWFALKERDLVEKYLYGDIPQGYNPISESKSVLSKRENPEKTTSINTAPANKTQVLKETNKPGLVPKSEDLDYPDITMVNVKPMQTMEETKLPDASDLEFPDIGLISSSVNKEFSSGGLQTHSPPVTTAIPKAAPAPKVAAPTPLPAEDEVINLPSDDDLAFPDMEAYEKTSTKVEKGKVDLNHQYTRTVALDNQQSSEALPLKLETEEEEQDLDMTVVIPAEWNTKEEAPAPVNIAAETEAIVMGKEPVNLKLHDKSTKKPDTARKQQIQPVDDKDKKLLHDRKPKNSKAAQRDPSRETAHKESEIAPKRNDNYIFFILIILVLIIVAVFFYFKEILNKPLPV